MQNLSMFDTEAGSVVSKLIWDGGIGEDGVERSEGEAVG